MPDKLLPVESGVLKGRAGSYTFTSVPFPLQSYGIKVGYGAGGAAGQTVRPGETAAPKQAGGCCS